MPCVPTRYPTEYQQLLVDMREVVQEARARNAWAEAPLAPAPAPAPHPAAAAAAAAASAATRSSRSSSISSYAAASSRSRTSASFPLWSDDTAADDTPSPDDSGFPFMFTSTTGRRVRDPYRIQALGMQQGGDAAAAAGLPPGALQGVQQALDNPTTGRVRMGITMNFIFIDGNQVRTREMDMAWRGGVSGWETMLYTTHGRCSTGNLQLGCPCTLRSRSPANPSTL